MAKKKKMTFKDWLHGKRNAAKKGSAFINPKTGKSQNRSDFERGVAMGEYKQACYSARKYNERKAKKA